MRALYISHNGMLEGLGQAQVLPYLRGLARRGVEIDLLSYELPDVEQDAVSMLQRSLRDGGIQWTPMRRRRDTRLVVKVGEGLKGAGIALTRALARRPNIVHGRSYLPTAVCDVVARIVPGAKLLFDCRGMIGDEYVDVGHWTVDRFEYKAVKRYEARAFERAEGVVVLTDALRRWLSERNWFGPRTNVEVIPCCVDLDRFAFDAAGRTRLRKELGIADDAFVLVYSGSLGTWYREAELARFAGFVRRRSRRPVAFLLLTRSPHRELVRALIGEGFADADIVVRGVQSAGMPAHLSAADVGLSFIKSCFSKTGSSPTKVAEYLACGLPVVLNGDIGDQAELAHEKEACVVIDSFSPGVLSAAAERAVALGSRSPAERVAITRRVADERFGLERVGVVRYERLYRSMLSSIS